jgi:hypothetical protein
MSQAKLRPIPSQTPPTAPSNLTVSLPADSSTELDLAWSPGTGQLQFLVERSGDGTSDWMQIAAIAGTNVAATDSGVSPECEYFYRVSATNSAGSSGYSNVASATTRLPTPNNLTNVAAAYNAVNVSWLTNGSTQTGFRIDISIDGGSTWNVGAEASATATDEVFNNCVIPDSTCLVRVTALGPAGNDSSATSPVTIAIPPVPAPTDLVITLEPGGTNILTWVNNASDLDYLHIELDAGDGSGFQEIADISNPGPSQYILDDYYTFAPATSYNMRLRIEYIPSSTSYFSGYSDVYTWVTNP